MKLRRKAQKHGVRTNTTSLEAWYYENAKSIEVYIVPMGSGNTVSCRIPRAELRDWLARTEPKEGG